MSSASPAPEIHPALAWAHPLVGEWFTAKFGTPTEPQIEGWPSILRGDPTLISAPTGSGKTLTAFLVCIDGLLRAALSGNLLPQTQVVYVSPLKALSNDIQKNLDAPLREIQALAGERGYLCPDIRTGVRTGDTLPKERASMLKHPPHILVTTPESLYILLTADKPRRNLTHVHTVIVDEIHAVADDKRGAHLALSLERLDALVCGDNRLSPGAMLTGRAHPPQRIGLSATQNPIELVASFLTGTEHPAHLGTPSSPTVPSSVGVGPHDARFTQRKPATIVQVGQRRTLDLGIEVPSDELGSITTIAMWTELFDKLAALTDHHRSTLVFVNTRRLVEKISFELTERLGPDAVAGHHGSLNRVLRLDAEQRLKNGEIKILIATASLELGIDIGSVDLVCQINTTRAVAVAMQRVGRAGHWRGAIPKGRFFATTRDDLLEQAALLRKMSAGELDRLEIPEAPMDVLMQQIVAACGAEPWEEEALYAVVRRAWPYRALTREQFNETLELLHEGIESSRGRYGAYLLRDRVAGVLHPRRGARMNAISNGGAIPDTSLFAVMLQPENVQIATLDEHFAIDSSPGDVVLLGNTSWRIQRIDTQGKVLVEDAHGAPPSIPFWEGEAPQRTGVLCDGVGDLRSEIDRRTRNVSPSQLTTEHSQPSSAAQPHVSAESPAAQVADTFAFLQRECFVCASGARQLVAYIVAGRAALGAVPTKTTIIAERFFDEGGGQQLILHAPFGGRINKAWGLALRKRFCRGFNFELQAAATDNGINISLAEQHSFPLADVFHFLTELTARDLLEQAAIPSPLFKNRWRWAAGRSLQLLRMQKGKRVAPQIQRTRSDDLLASVFPHASACPETMTGDIEIPDHPLVREVMRDTLTEAMDIDGLNDLLRGIATGAIQTLAVDTPVPSLFAHELIHAMPYSFLDEEDDARRARATNTRRALPDEVTAGAGRIDQAAIDTVRAQLQPDIRDEHELHDLLLSLVALPLSYVGVEPAVPPTATVPLGGSSALQPTDKQALRNRALVPGSFTTSAEGPGPKPLDSRGCFQEPEGPCSLPNTAGAKDLCLLLDTSETAVHSAPRTATSADEPEPVARGANRTLQHWPLFIARLKAQGRAHEVLLGGEPAWLATERLAEAALLWPDAAFPRPLLADEPQARVIGGTEYRPTETLSPRDAATQRLTQGWLQILGPTTADALASRMHLHPRSILQSLLAMEMQGLALRGVYEHPKAPAEAPMDEEWCERRILHRIHRLTLGTLRKSVEPVTPAIFMRWLLDWHHVAPETQLSGEEGVLAAIEQLEGFEAPAAEWERTLLPARVGAYDPRWLDNLCLAGVIGWGRISPHPAWHVTGLATDEAGAAAKAGPRRVIPTSAAPITFFLRESADWLHQALAAKCVEEATLAQSLSPEAQVVRGLLAQRGAAFLADIQRLSGLSKLQTSTALWELATAGLASADGFDQLRAMMDPRRKSVAVAQTAATSLRKRAAARTTAGRWSLLCESGESDAASEGQPPSSGQGHALNLAHATEAQRARMIAEAKARETALDAQARLLLCRYGVLFRELLTRESNAPKWRDLAPVLRRLEARGEIRGGRFVSGAFGEQFALAEAVDALRDARRAAPARSAEAPITLAASDPLNLVGIVVPGEREPAIPGREVRLQNGTAYTDEAEAAAKVAIPTRPKAQRTRSIADILRSGGAAVPLPAPSRPAGSMDLFS